MFNSIVALMGGNNDGLENGAGSHRALRQEKWNGIAMRLEAPPQICVVKKEDKEAKIGRFLRRNVNVENDGEKAFSASRLLMIARSVESPAARALLQFCSEPGCEHFEVQIILTSEDGLLSLQLGERGDRLSAMKCRLASDIRLLDAHELLVLGPATAWIGDCMRRDPSKHDAYEFYSEDAPEAARTAAKSFERIWMSAQPLTIRGVPAAPMPDVAAISAEAAQAAPAQKTAEAATRH